MTENAGMQPEVGHGLTARVDADHVEFALGAVGIARGREMDVGQALVGLAVADDVTMRQSSARLLVAREAARLEMSAAAAVLANHVEIGPRAAVGVVVARSVEGDVRPLLDWRGALVFGAAFAAVSLVLRPLGRRGRRGR